MPPVDLVDDLQVARQQVLEEVDGPALQSLRQDGVVGVGAGTNHNVPGLDTQRTGPGGLGISDIITHTRISDNKIHIFCSTFLTNSEIQFNLF